MTYEASYDISQRDFDDSWDQGDNNLIYTISIEVDGEMQKDPFGTGDRWYSEFYIEEYRFYVDGSPVDEDELEQLLGVDSAGEVKYFLWESIGNQHG